MTTLFGAEFRRIDNREHLGKPAIVAIATRLFPTTIEDLWEAVTTPERLARWFVPVTGELRLGGRFQVTGNASGTVLRCDPPEAFDVTWEFAGATSWVHVRLEAVGKQARFTLEHIAHADGPGKDHFEKFGPGAVGVGWDLTIHGLGMFIDGGGKDLDRPAIDAWLQSADGKGFMRASAEAWGTAHAASGADAEQARAMAERTIAAYTGG